MSARPPDDCGNALDCGAQAGGQPSARKRDVRILAAGVDSLYASVAQGLSCDRLADVLRLRGKAQDDREEQVWDMPGSERTFLVQRRGFRNHMVWMESPAMHLRLGPEDPHHPDLYLELRSAFLHQVGVEEAVAEADRVAAHFCPGTAPPGGPQVPAEFRRDLPSDHLPGRHLTASRIDLHVDVQGWAATRSDDERFVCRSVNITDRDVNDPDEDGRRSRRRAGKVFSGFDFGHGAVKGRVYNKTLELRARRQNWPEVIWEGMAPDEPVWRVEIQFRREALVEFRCGRARLDTVADVLAARQRLWEYGVGKWLTLRNRTVDANRSRWPIDHAWAVIRQAPIGSPCSPLVRERIRGSEYLALLQGFTGYASSLAARGSSTELAEVLGKVAPAVESYLASRGRSFSGDAARKRELDRAV